MAAANLPAAGACQLQDVMLRTKLRKPSAAPSGRKRPSRQAQQGVSKAGLPDAFVSDLERIVGACVDAVAREEMLYWGGEEDLVCMEWDDEDDLASFQDEADVSVLDADMESGSGPSAMHGLFEDDFDTYSIATQEFEASCGEQILRHIANDQIEASCEVGTCAKTKEHASLTASSSRSNCGSCVSTCASREEGELCANVAARMVAREQLDSLAKDCRHNGEIAQQKEEMDCPSQDNISWCSGISQAPVFTTKCDERMLRSIANDQVEVPCGAVDGERDDVYGTNIDCASLDVVSTVSNCDSHVSKGVRKNESEFCHMLVKEQLDCLAKDGAASMSKDHVRHSQADTTLSSSVQCLREFTTAATVQDEAPSSKRVDKGSCTATPKPAPLELDLSLQVEAIDLNKQASDSEPCVQAEVPDPFKEAVMLGSFPQAVGSPLNACRARSPRSPVSSQYLARSKEKGRSLSDLQSAQPANALRLMAECKFESSALSNSRGAGLKLPVPKPPKAPRMERSSDTTYNLAQAMHSREKAKSVSRASSATCMRSEARCAQRPMSAKSY